MLRRLRARTGEQLVLISVGGIETADDVWQRIRAGAALVQLYTAFIYEGPLLPRRLNHGLRQHLQASGFATLNAAVGSESPMEVRPTGP